MSKFFIKSLEKNCENNYFLNVDDYLSSNKSIVPTTKTLNILQYNVRSMINMNTFDDVLAFTERLNENIDIIVLGETWVQSKNTLTFQLTNYRSLFSCRNDRPGGGLAVYIRNDINFNILNCDDDQFQYHFIGIDLPEYNATQFWAFYRPPNSDIDLFLSFLDSFELNKSSDTIMVGDFNIPVNKNTNSVLDYKNILMSSGMIVTNTFATRTISNNIIDHLACSFSNISTVRNSTIFSDISDHNFVFSSLSFKVKFFRKKLEQKIIDFNAVDACFMDFINSTEFDTANPETTLKLITEKYNQLIDTYTVKKSVIAKLKNNSCPWMTYNVWLLIGERNKVLKRSKLNPVNPEFQNRLRILNKQIKSMKYFAKKHFYENMFSNVNQRNLWKNINQLLNRNNPKSDIFAILFNDQKCTDTKEIVNIFNNYFVDIGISLGTTIGSYRDIHKFNTIRSNPNSMVLSSTTPAEILTIICALNNSNGGGPDNMRNGVLKRNAFFFSELLAKLFNQILETGVYPDILKTAKVIPIFKQGDKSLISNYRPISTLSVFDKILEKLLNSRFRSFLNKTSFFYSYQYGFREGAGTEQALVETTNLIYNAFDKKKYVGALFLDLRKAFDTVDHELLLAKLYCFGFRGVAHNLIESYLKNRQQFVQIEESRSSILKVTCGVPQGSVLGPLLFLIFINDISYLPLSGHVRIFADDTAIFYETCDPQSIITNMKHDMNILLEYFKSNVISLNLTKTKFMIFHSPHKTPVNVGSFNINNIVVEKVECFKYLGMSFDTHMCWDEHIKALNGKIAPLIGLVRRLSYHLPKYVLKLMYFGFIHCRFLYGISNYGTASTNKLKKLQRMQNKCVKAISKLPLRFPTVSLYETAAKGILPISALHEYQTSLYMYKALKVPSALSNLEFSSVNHNYHTRFANNLVGGSICNEYGRKSIRFSGPAIYNKLPTSLKNSLNFQHFKKNLKLYYGTLIKDYIN